MVNAWLLVWRSQISNHALIYRTKMAYQGNKDRARIHYKKVIKEPHSRNKAASQ